MKFQIGHVFRFADRPIISLILPGIGVLQSLGPDQEGFDHINLDNKQLKKLKRQIEKELEKPNGKKSNVE